MLQRTGGSVGADPSELIRHYRAALTLAMRDERLARTRAADVPLLPRYVTKANRQIEIANLIGLASRAKDVMGGNQTGRGITIARVICDISVSLDGYVTGPNDSRENQFGDGGDGLHDWLSGAATDADRALLQGGQ